MKGKLMFIVVLISLFLTGSILAADYDVHFLVSWAAEKMGVEIKTDEKVLPRIVWCQKEELYKKIAEEMTLQLGDNSPYFQGFSAMKIVEENEVEAYYSSIEKTIYLLKGAPDYVLLHEVAHFVQDIYLKKIPQLPTGETKKFLEENASHILQVNQQLEEEAERITEAFQKEQEILRELELAEKVNN